MSQKKVAIGLYDEWTEAAKKAGYTRLLGYLSADGKTVRLEAQACVGDRHGPSSHCNCIPHSNVERRQKGAHD